MRQFPAEKIYGAGERLWVARYSAGGKSDGGVCGSSLLGG